MDGIDSRSKIGQLVEKVERHCAFSLQLAISSTRQLSQIVGLLIGVAPGENDERN